MNSMLTREIETITDDQFTLSDAAVADAIALMDEALSRSDDAVEGPRPHLWARLRSGLTERRGRVGRRGWSLTDERPIDRTWGAVHVATARTRQSVTSF